MDAERVDAIAARQQAVAAVNGGFFNTRNGEPVSLLKVNGELVSDNTLARGIVAIRPDSRGKPQLDFDQATAKMTLRFTVAGKDTDIVIDGVDTTRARGKLMMYTPLYHRDTDTAANGIEWVLSDNPLRVTEIRRDAGHTPIPPNGAVLSFGGLDPPPALAALAMGTRVTLLTNWRAIQGTPPKQFDQARDIVNGAGLLKKDNRSI